MSNLDKDSGWITIHRRIKDNWIWQENRVFSKAEAWIDILLSANHKENKTVLGSELITVKRGSFITSEVKLMKRWNWSKSKLRSFLILLEKELMIEKKTDSKKTTLRVVRYCDYQNLKTAKKPQKNRKPTAKELQTDTNNNDNNDNNENNIYRSFDHLSLSIDEFEKLELTYEKNKIDSIIDNIENYKNNKNYKSLYLTSVNWLKREYPNYSKPKKIKKVTWSDFYEKDKI